LAPNTVALLAMSSAAAYSAVQQTASFDSCATTGGVRPWAAGSVRLLPDPFAEIAARPAVAAFRTTDEMPFRKGVAPPYRNPVLVVSQHGVSTELFVAAHVPPAGTGARRTSRGVVATLS